MAAFRDKSGNLVLPTVDADGNVPVALDDEGTSDVPSLLSRLCWEVQELRRVYCEATDQLFREYPGDD